MIASIVVATAAATAATLLASQGLRRMLPLLDRLVLALPTDRSSHTRPTPCGGGVAIVALLVPAIAAATLLDPGVPWLQCAVATVALAWCSWIDDRRGVAPAVRLAVQTAAVAVVLAGLDGPTFAGLPAWADAGVVGLGWLWFVNLYNFMDGTDGLAGVETVCVGAGIVAVALTGGVSSAGIVVVPAVAAGASLGFLRWNWSPARVFLGDVGSIPLGFVLGFALLLLWRSGHPVAALLLPALFVADASLTLLRRVAAGHRPWHAHREHAYQRAATGPSAHAHVAREAAATNVVLVVLAVLSGASTRFAVVAGLATVALRLVGWERIAARGGR
jgi:UDP-N-acetylmuramyl pentapeptide phosphotransferase/UDP-N-acetylglucosamine-1-phosphate transferase